MGAYQASRNIEASIIDYVKEQLVVGSWTNVQVEKAYAKINQNNLPGIWIHLTNTSYRKVQIGDNSVYRVPLVLIEIYGTSDGMREDLKDFLVLKFLDGCPYYNYTIQNGAVQSKVQDGRIKVNNIDDSIVNLGIDKNELDIIDRYRHLISLQVELGKVEV